LGQQSRLSGLGHAVAVIAPALLVVALGGLAYTATQRLAAHAEQIARVHRASVAWEEVMGLLIDSESAARGFVMTGDTAFLAPHRLARRGVDAQLAILRASIRDPRQRSRLEAMVPLIERKLAVGDQFIALTLAGEAEQARALIVGGLGLNVMDEVRAAMKVARTAQAALAADRVRDASSTAARLTVLIFAAALLSLLLALLANLVLSRYLRVQQRLAGELAASNTQLQEQALELELQSDELQAQASQLEETAVELEATAEERETLLAAEQEARRAAEEANAAKSAFLAAMSHELRTPLNAIAGYIDLLRLEIHGPVTAAQQGALERVRRNQQHLLELISDLLNYAKLEAGRIEYRIAPVPVAELLGELEPLIQPLIERGALHYSCTVDTPTHAYGDRDRIEQILLNLIGNAIKFTPPGGRIEVTAQAEHGWVRLGVRDSGPGIPADMTSKIFEPFVQLDRYQVDSSRQGIGLGLAISRDLAEAMAGRIEVSSEPGAGSTFTLALPAWEPVTDRELVEA
jgi:signal transduction histidine kinase